MAFVNALFPNPRLLHDLRKTVALPTTIVGNSSVEYRIRKLANYRSAWVWPSRSLLVADSEAIQQFYTETAQFSLNSFKFQDPTLCKWTLTPLTYSGSGNNFYLTTRGTQDTHPVFHLGGDVVVKVGATTTAFTKVIVNGVPMVNVPGATSNVNITGTFYHAARFDQAEMERTLAALNTDNSARADVLGDVSLIEVFEY
jgi:hypothetical protein